MNFNIKNRIKEAIVASGYSRTANLLLKLSDAQLADIGVSRALLNKGFHAYPWRVEAQAQVIPDNVSQFHVAKPATTVNETAVMQQTPKAA